MHLKRNSLNKNVALISMFIIIWLLGSITNSLAQEPWTTKAPMPTARLWFSFEVVDGKIYAIGGATVNGAPTLGTVEVYDPATNSWDTTKTDMPTARCLIASAVVDGEIYIVGGDRKFQMYQTNGVRTLEVYDTTNDTWDSTKTDMPTARSAASACAVNGIIYVIGGVKPGGVALNIVEAYDPATDTWTTKAPMLTARWALLTVVVDGKIYAMGTGQGGRNVEEYDPATDTWTKKASMPVGLGYFGTGVVDGIIYIMGGASGPGSGYSQLFAYDPPANEWSEKSAMPTARWGLSAGVVNGKIYAIGGTPGLNKSPVRTNEEYIPHLDLLHLIEKVDVSRRFVKPGIDSVVISTKIKDPTGITLMAKIKIPDQTPVGSLQLFDDGNHHDGNAGDSLYSNVWQVSTSEERLHYVDLQVMRIDTDIVIHRMNNMALFTTIGPLVFEGFTFKSSDSEPNPGDEFDFKVILKNNGSIASATDVKLKLSCLDTAVTLISNNRSYSDIEPGNSKTSSYYRIKISENCPASTEIKFAMDITSNDYSFWTDTCSILVVVDSTTSLNINERTPKQFNLNQNYPNPFNPKTSIGYSLPINCDVELYAFNILGQKISTLVNKHQNAGNYTVNFNAKNLPSGIYFYKLKAGEKIIAAKKMTLMR